MTCGIYKLTFASGNFYIGKSTDIERRWRQHYDSMVKGKHTRNLQAEFDIYRDYEQEVLFECHEDHIDIMEETLIEWKQPVLNGTKGRDRLAHLEDLDQLPIFLPYLKMSTLHHIVELHNGKSTLAEVKDQLRIQLEAAVDLDDRVEWLEGALEGTEAKVTTLETTLVKAGADIEVLKDQIVYKDKIAKETNALVTNLSMQRSTEEIERDTLNRLVAARKSIEVYEDCNKALIVELEALNAECNKLFEYKQLPWYKKIFA